MRSPARLQTGVMDIETRFAFSAARASGSWRLWCAAVCWVIGARGIAGQLCGSVIYPVAVNASSPARGTTPPIDGAAGWSAAGRVSYWGRCAILGREFL